MKPKLTNKRADKRGHCRFCREPFHPGDEISVLVEPNRELAAFLGKPQKPDIHVYHRACMDEYLRYRVEIGRPVR